MSSHGSNAWYPWHVKDYRASRKVQRMGYIARGLYRELLDEQFIEGSLPDDIEALAEICDCSIRVMERAWKELAPCFQKIDDRLVNAKLEEMRTEKDKIRIKRVEAGRLGGIAKNNALANANQVLANAKHVPVSREERVETEKKRTLAQSEVERVYAAYSRHVGKGAALKAIDRALKRIAPDRDADWLLARTQRFATARQFDDKQYIPHPAT